MSVDLIKALSSSAPESRRSEGSGRESEFPGVLKSTLDSKPAGGARRAQEADASSSSQQSQQAEQPKSDAEVAEATREADAQPSAEDARDPHEAKDVSEAATEAGSVELPASASIDPAREGLALQAQRQGEGRLTDLEARNASGGTLEPQLEEGKAGQPVSREIGEELLAAIDADRAGPGPEEAEEGQRGGQQEGRLEGRGEERAEAERAGQASNGAVQEAALRTSQDVGAVATEASTAASPSESARDAASDLRAGANDLPPAGAPEDSGSSADRSGADSGSDRSPEEDPRFQETAAQTQRAAEANAAAEIDANLRQAIATQSSAERAPDSAPIDGAAAVANPVAGTASEVTTTATPGTPTPPAASDAIAVQTEWLLSRGGGTARLMLHPQELGEISIRVTLRGDAVDVVMMAHEAATKGIAEEQAERLSQAFSNRDLRMENFEVRRGAPEDLPDGGERFAESGRDRDPSRGGEGGSRAGRGADGSSDKGRRVNAQEIAAMPRIMTVAPETGVDLRI